MKHNCTCIVNLLISRFFSGRTAVLHFLQKTMIFIAIYSNNCILTLHLMIAFKFGQCSKMVLLAVIQL